MEYIIMNKKELQQAKIFEQVKTGVITQKVASAQLNMSTRWIRKKIKRYKMDGDKGLVHLSRGKSSSRKWKNEEIAILLHLLQNEWHDFGPTFAAEKLQEIHSIKVSRETVRRVMIQNGLWKPKINRFKHRKWRDRKKLLGMMVQLDGSPHDWFEGRAPKCTLIVFIDDATSQILWLELAPTESMQALMQATKNYVEKHGAPQSLYTDHGSVFHVNNNNPEGDRKTHWEIAMQQLNINVIHAHSPQAKGRVERANQTMQDHLPKEFRLQDISSIEKANDWLQNSHFIEKHNNKFAYLANQSGDAHRDVSFDNLIDIFSIKETRILCNDYTLTYQKQIFQIMKQRKVGIKPKIAITVRTDLNNNITLWLRGFKLPYSIITSRPQRKIQEKIIIDKAFKPNKSIRLLMSGQYSSLNMESRVKTAMTAVESER